MSKKPSARRGYTFVELMIVSAIIGILIALLLPAVQAAREAARRMSCANNLGQLIIAVHCYEMHHGVYPPGTIDGIGPIRALPSGYHHNWIIQILPYLEQKNTHAHIDPSAGVYDLVNAPVRQLRLQVLLCPSQGTQARGYSDYAGVHHDVEAPIDVDNNGVFFLNTPMHVADIKDGTSQTLFVGEKLTFAGDLGWMSGTRSTLRNTGLIVQSGWRSGSPQLQSPSIDDEVGSPRVAPTDSELLDGLYGMKQFIQPQPESGRRPWPGSLGGMMSMPGAAEVSVAQQTIPTDATLAVGGFGSRHPGGVQFALGDGSVNFVSQTIDVQTYIQLGNRADNRLIQSDW